LRAHLERELAGATATLIVDLSKVQFLGSSGLAVLVEMTDAAAQHAVRLRLVCSSREVVRPLQATGLTELFAIYPDLPAALAES
jgi:anti-sigma B factor antagonist